MNKDEFRKEVDEFWAWVSSVERPPSGWFLSLELWTEKRFNEEYNKEHAI